MPKQRKNEIIRCRHFKWVLRQRDCVWYADGRSNPTNAGRHSLDTKDKDEALRLLHELDQQRAEDLGLVPKTSKRADSAQTLDLDKGYKLYEKHFTRPRVAGGVKERTVAKYRNDLGKFIKFAKSRGITTWNGVSDELLTEFAATMDEQGYAHKTQLNHLVTIKQALNLLQRRDQLQGVPPSELKLQKAGSEPAYCYRTEEVQAMVMLCQSDEKLAWLNAVLVGLACTGLRIGEFSSLRWVDIDKASGCLVLTDETGYRQRAGRQRRQVKSSRKRSFPIHPDFAAVLKTLPRIDGYIFHGPRGGRLKPDTVRNVLKRDVITPLLEQFPTPEDEKGFRDGRLHSFRHYFCSTCANNNVPERMVMNWLGHADSEMIRHYYHVHNEEAKRRMENLNFLGSASGRSAGGVEDKPEEEDVEPRTDEADENESA